MLYKGTNSTIDPTDYLREGGRLQRRSRSLIVEFETTLMADDNTLTLIKEVLDDTLYGKLEEMIVRILKAIRKQPMERDTETSTQH